MTFRPGALLTLLTLLFLGYPAAVAAQDEREAAVDEIMSTYTDGTPGAVVAVVEDGEIVFAKAYGTANLEHGVPLERETVLDIGSVAKQFTAFAVILLEQEGALSLDDDVREHLPDVPDFGHVITIRHLVHHMSGLREIYNAKALEGYQGGDGIVQADALHLTKRMRELNFEPGTEYLYCNTGYMLLADIVAAASGKTFPEFMDERVFGPLGMTHTTIMSRRGQSIAGAAESYAELEEGGYVRVLDNSGLFGAGGIYTTVDDLARWMSNFSSGSVGGPEAIAQMQHRGVLADGDTLSYAFGINVGEARGLRLLAHGGSSAGFRASFNYLPELDAGVITMSNFAQFDGSIPQRIGTVFFEEHMEPEEESEEEPRETHTPERPDGEVVVSEETLESYVGDYELDVAPGFILSMTREGNRLFGQATGQNRNPFTPSSDSTFHLRDIASVTFHREADGSVNSMTLHQNGDHLARRVEAWRPTEEALLELTGQYYSPELETVYTLEVEDGKLIAKHRRHADFELSPTEEDVYRGAGFFGEARFERNDAGEPTGMRVSNGRVRNLLFEKMRH